MSWQRGASMRTLYALNSLSTLSKYMERLFSPKSSFTTSYYLMMHFMPTLEIPIAFVTRCVLYALKILFSPVCGYIYSL